MADHETLDFRYTKQVTDVDSSVIDAVYYNGNENYVVLDVNDEMYKYTDVPEQAVNDLIAADSIGAHYNQVFKKEFGPSEHLGSYDDVWWSIEPLVKNNTTNATPKDLASVTDINAGRVGNASLPTKEYSLGTFDQSVSGAPIAVADEPTKEFSLRLVEDNEVAFEDEDGQGIEAERTQGIEGVTAVVVHFSLTGQDGKYKYRANSVDADEAIEELHQYLVRMGAHGRVRKVVLKF